MHMWVIPFDCRSAKTLQFLTVEETFCVEGERQETTGIPGNEVFPSEESFFIVPKNNRISANLLDEASR
jgi:hypothetical protein